MGGLAVLVSLVVVLGLVALVPLLVLTLAWLTKGRMDRVEDDLRDRFLAKWRETLSAIDGADGWAVKNAADPYLEGTLDGVPARLWMEETTYLELFLTEPAPLELRATPRRWLQVRKGPDVRHAEHLPEHGLLEALLPGYEVAGSADGLAWFDPALRAALSEAGARLVVRPDRVVVTWRGRRRWDEAAITVDLARRLAAAVRAPLDDGLRARLVDPGERTEMRLAAFDRLEARGGLSDALVARLVDDADARVAVAAAQHRGDHERLVAMAHDPARGLHRVEAAAALPASHDAKLGAFRVLLEGDTRRAALHAASVTPDPVLLPLLLEVLDDLPDDRALTQGLLGAIGALGDERAEPGLRGLLTSPDDHRRFHATLALATCGTGDSQAALRRVIADAPERLAQEARDTLRAIQHRHQLEAGGLMMVEPTPGVGAVSVAEDRGRLAMAERAARQRS